MTHRNLIRRLIQTLYLLDDLYMQMGKDINISSNALVLFYALDDGQMYTQKAISEQWGISRTTLNTIVKKYEQEGYIRLEPVPKTRRDMALVLTDEGQVFAKQLLEYIHQIEEEALRLTLQEVSSDFIPHFELFARNMERAINMTEKKEINDNDITKLN